MCGEWYHEAKLSIANDPGTIVKFSNDPGLPGHRRYHPISMPTHLGKGILLGRPPSRVSAVDFVMTIRAKGNRITDFVGTAFIDGLNVVDLHPMQLFTKAAAAAGGRK
jgi:hypothetical protein